MTPTDPPSDVPAGETPAATCQYCGRPFRNERSCALHLGEVHSGECTTAETDAYENARETERDELFVYHMKVVVALAVIYGVTIVAYMVALGSGLL